MYNNYYRMRRRPIPNNNRFLGGGFLAPFLLGGLTGGLLAPAFYGPRPVFYPPYGISPYGPYQTYYY